MQEEKEKALLLSKSIETLEYDATLVFFLNGCILVQFNFYLGITVKCLILGLCNLCNQKVQDPRGCVFAYVVFKESGSGLSQFSMLPFSVK